jgi:hypothetical protein
MSLHGRSEREELFALENERFHPSLRIRSSLHFNTHAGASHSPLHTRNFSSAKTHGRVFLSDRPDMIRFRPAPLV